VTSIALHTAQSTSAEEKATAECKKLLCKNFKSEKHWPSLVLGVGLNTGAMATVIYKPYKVLQTVGESQLTWTLSNVTWATDSELCWCGPLRAVATHGGLSDRSVTGQLEYHNYRYGNTVAGTLTGIELMVYAHKQSRVLDKVVQLKKDGVLIGNNQVQNNVNNQIIYGGAADMWGTALTLNDILSISVVLQYQSNNSIPHSDTVSVNTAWLRLTYTP
jgi:hypothetical protein